MAKKLTVVERIISIQNERNLVRRKKQATEDAQGKASEQYEDCDRQIDAGKRQLMKLLANEIKIGNILEGTRWSIRYNSSGLILTGARSNKPFKDFIREHEDGREYSMIELRSDDFFIRVETDYSGKKIRSIMIDDRNLEQIDIAAWLKKRGAIVTNSEGKKRMKELKEQISDHQAELAELEAFEAAGVKGVLT